MWTRISASDAEMGAMGLEMKFGRCAVSGCWLRHIEAVNHLDVRVRAATSEGGVRAAKRSDEIIARRKDILCYLDQILPRSGYRFKVLAAAVMQALGVERVKCW
jgi:hypothetical protein